MAAPAYVPMRTGVRGDGEWWTVWAVFPGHVTDDEIAEVFDLAAFDGGPGRQFSHGGYIRRTPTRALARRSGGLDI